MPLIRWANVSANGSIYAASEGISITRIGDGQYAISFSPPFSKVPAIVGTQTGYGTINERTTDNVVFPFVSEANATALTGDDKGIHVDRGFSIIAIGD